MSNAKTTIMMPDTIERFIDHWLERFGFDFPTQAQKTEGFQEIINLIAILMSGEFDPDWRDPTYFRQMEDNIRAFGHSREVTLEAQAIGWAFLAEMEEVVKRPAFKDLQKNTRCGEEPDLFEIVGLREHCRNDEDDGQA